MVQLCKATVIAVSLLFLSSCSVDVGKTIDKGTAIIDSIQNKTAAVTNKVTSMNKKVKVIKEMKMEQKGKSFKLEDVFNYCLDHPTYKIDKVDDMDVVSVSGGMSKQLQGNYSSTNGNDNDPVSKLMKETSSVTYIFPFDGEKLLSDQVGYYVEMAGKKVYGENGPLLLQSFVDQYVNQKLQ